MARLSALLDLAPGSPGRLWEVERWPLGLCHWLMGHPHQQNRWQSPQTGQSRRHRLAALPQQRPHPNFPPPPQGRPLQERQVPTLGHPQGLNPPDLDR